MSLRWSWDNQIGEIEWYDYDGETYKTECYKGNALLIDLRVAQDKSWTMNFFICDKDHFKNICKDKDWDFSEHIRRARFWKMDSEIWSLCKELQRRGVPIEIYNGDIRDKIYK